MINVALVICFALLVCGLDELTFRDFVVGVAAGGVVFGIIGLLA